MSLLLLIRLRALTATTVRAVWKTLGMDQLSVQHLLMEAEEEDQQRLVPLSKALMQVLAQA